MSANELKRSPQAEHLKCRFPEAQFVELESSTFEDIEPQHSVTGFGSLTTTLTRKC
jgi:hypothetical protein